MYFILTVDASLRQSLLINEKEDISVITNDDPITPSSISSSRSYTDNPQHQASTENLISNTGDFKRDLHSAVLENKQRDNRMLRLGYVY